MRLSFLIIICIVNNVYTTCEIDHSINPYAHYAHANVYACPVFMLTSVPFSLDISAVVLPLMFMFIPLIKTKL